MNRIFSLLLGFGLGQGSMFLAQTYLLYHQRFELASSSAIGLGFLSLTYWTVEMGGIFTFNKAFQKSTSDICNYFTARFILGLGVAVISLVALISIKAKDELLFGVITIAPAIAVATTVSLLGYIDATQKNQKISHMSGLPWIFASISLLLPQHLTTPYQHGITIGLAFLAGQLLFTLAQHACMRREVNQLNFKSIKNKEVISYLKDGVAYNISFSSSQIYGRTTPMLIDTIIGAKISSLYIYTRNITNMFSQVAIFAKRIEFNRLSQTKDHRVTTLIKLQNISSSLTAIFFTTTLASIGISQIIEIDSLILQEASSILSLQIIIYLLFNIAGLYSQPLSAKGMIMTNAMIQAFQSIVCLALAYPALMLGGLNFMLLSEACVISTGIIVYSYRLRQAIK